MGGKPQKVMVCYCILVPPLTQKLSTISLDIPSNPYYTSLYIIIYVLLCIPIPSFFFAKSPNFMMKRPFFTIELLPKEHHSFFCRLSEAPNRYTPNTQMDPNGTSMQKVLKLWVFTGSTHPFLRFHGGSFSVAKTPAGSGLLGVRRPPRRSRSSSSPEPGDRRRGGRPSRRHRPSARDTWGSGHANRGNRSDIQND